MITKKKLVKFVNSVTTYCLIAMSLGLIAGCFLLVLNMFWQIVFK